MALAGTSFKDAAQTVEAPQRLIISVSGDERCGKTHFALTAPGPIAFMQLDPGSGSVITKLKAQFKAAGKKIYHAQYQMRPKPSMTKDQMKAEATKEFERWAKDYQAAIAEMRTVIIDTGSEAYKTCKLKWFGKLTQVMPEDYQFPNGEFSALVRQAYDYPCNVIWLHKQKDEYDRPKGGGKGSGNKTGNRVRDGWGGLGYEVDIEATAYKDDGLFVLDFKNCRQNPELDGETMILDPESGFRDVAMRVYPESDESDWV